MEVQEIVQAIQKGGTRMTATETRKILAGIRAEEETRLHAVLVGVLMHHRASAMAEELEVIISDAEATAETATVRVNKLQQALDAADLAVRKAKAAKIMLPSTAAQSELSKADQAIRKAERDLRKAGNNLQAGKNVAEQRQREIADLRALHRALASVGMPDVTPIRALLDAAR